MVRDATRRGGSNGYGGSAGTTLFCALFLVGLVCFKLGRLVHTSSSSSPLGMIGGGDVDAPFHNVNDNDPLRPKAGKAVALPSVRVQDENLEPKRTIYGGKGDGKHLGGWTDIDIHGISIYLWKHMVTDLGIKSILDVGCGRGISTTWFLMNGVDALCVEGSHDAYDNSVLPDKATQMIEHDFSRGPWWPEKTYDAVWCVEFLEHVGRNFHKNYLPAFRKAAMLFVTHSNWGGWHHVEVHSDDWWIRKFELYGFRYMPELTLELRETARKEALKSELAVNGEKANPQNLYTMLVFFNPAVGALPQHAHLFAEPGCFLSRPKGSKTITRDCTNEKDEEPLPPEFKPLPLSEDTQKKWEQHIRGLLQQPSDAMNKNAPAKKPPVVTNNNAQAQKPPDAKTGT